MNNNINNNQNNNLNNMFSVSKDYYNVKKNNTIGKIIKEDEKYIYFQLYDKNLLIIEKEKLKII